jgi:hypothetical protein
MSENAYVYVHKRLDTGQPFYVGKGSGNRATSKKDRNPFWRRIVAKAGYEVIIIQSGLTHQQAFNAEKFVIAALKNKVSLANLTDGGDGGNGLKGEDHPLYGKPRSPEVREKLSNALKGRSFPHCASRKGKKMDEETKKKISDALKGKEKTKEHIFAASTASKLAKELKYPKKEKIKKPHGLIGKKLSAEHIAKSAETRKRNNIEHPELRKFGEKAPNFKGWYITPLGKFDRPEDAAKAHGCDKTTISRRCKGRFANGKNLMPQAGYAFKQKVAG